MKNPWMTEMGIISLYRPHPLIPESQLAILPESSDESMQQVVCTNNGIKLEVDKQACRKSEASNVFYQAS